MQKLKGKRCVFAIFLLPVITYQETSEKSFIYLQKKTTENEKENEEFVGTSLMRGPKTADISICFGSLY